MMKQHPTTDRFPGIQYSSSDENEDYVRPRRHRRRRRKQESTQAQCFETKPRDEYKTGNEFSTGYTTPKQNGVLKYNRQEDSTQSEDTLCRRRRNVKICVKPMCPKNVPEKCERTEFETCHKAMEARGYCPVNDADPRSTRCNTQSPCSSRGASMCRDHIYRPVIDPTRKRCDDDFICGLQARCEADRKYAVGHDVNSKGVHSGCEDTKINDSILYRPFPCEKHHKECQTTKCDESPHSKNSIRYNEITLFPTKSCGNAPHLNYIIHKKKDDYKTSHEREEHLFPFKKTPEGKLQFDSSMIYYQDDKMMLLVADQNKVNVRFKSSIHPNCGRKMHKEYKNVKKAPRACAETDADRRGLCYMDAQIPERDCDVNNLR